ncbi:MAG TPA: hypothetical protein VJX74_13210 [Blastocatellia bacterium]|nr:hypothetical protein [Blastocatellia bacterium]
MKRIKLVCVLALLIITSSAVQAQDRAINSRAAKHNYSPRITGRSNSMIVEGRITEIRDDLVSIKTARGIRYDFRIDDQTTTLNSDELISIATMSEITLSVSDLRITDLIEIVAERTGRQAAARIITRIASSGDHIASR